MNLPVIQTHNNISFPDVEQALLEPDGLLAMGGDLSVKRLLSAYSSGIFPWFSDGEPILWWSPNPRMVLFPEYFKCSKSLKKSINNKKFQVIYNRNFLNVMKQCSKPRPLQQGTWITEEMLYAYQQLHLAGYAHSVETWLDGKLVGGLYGIAIGRV
ncbi:MAG: leucyl/phenylalanyl-tRNA--protein transferase, partial [Methylococcales bacterium]|nr:leucyl/phenylalanyl-tRNA--protein transferase [Methylococcales bacterium]